jgi:integrase
MTIALEWERAAKLARRGEFTEAQARDVLADILKRADMGEAFRTVSVRDYFQAWLTTKEERLAAGSFVRYKTVVDLFLISLGSCTDKPLTSLTSTEIDRFLDARLRGGLAPSTAILDVKILRIALNAARRKGLIPTNPAEAVDLPKAKGVVRGTFTPAEVGMLVAKAKGEWKTLVLLGYYTGARLSDCCRMAWENLDLAGESLTFVVKKTGKPLTIPIHPGLMEHLDSLAGIDTPEPYIMPAMANMSPGGKHGLSEGFKRIMGKAGVDPQTVKGHGKRNISKRTFHALRHSFTSALANAGVPEELRMKLTGHTTKAVHQGYTHHELETLRAALGNLTKLK